jgi:hypothetical protein
MPRSVVVGFLTAHVLFPCACPVSAGLCKSCSPYRLRCRPASYSDRYSSAADKGGCPGFMLMRRRHRTAFVFPGHQRFLPGASIELPSAVACHIDDRNERQCIQGQFGKSSRHCHSFFLGRCLMVQTDRELEIGPWEGWRALPESRSPAGNALQLLCQRRRARPDAGRSLCARVKRSAPPTSELHGT